MWAGVSSASVERCPIREIWDLGWQRWLGWAGLGLGWSGSDLGSSGGGHDSQQMDLIGSDGESVDSWRCGFVELQMDGFVSVDGFVDLRIWGVFFCGFLSVCLSVWWLWEFMMDFAMGFGGSTGSCGWMDVRNKCV